MFEEEVEIDVGAAHSQYQPEPSYSGAAAQDTYKQEEYEYKPTSDEAGSQSQIISDLNKMKLQDGASSGLDDVFE